MTGNHLPPSRHLLVATAAFMLAGAAIASAARGHSEFQAYFQSTLKDAAYQRKTYDRVLKAWKHPPVSQAPALGQKTVVQAVIAKDGKLASATVSLTSGSKSWDAAALAAVKKAAPFDPLPASYTYPTVEVHFHVAWVMNR